MQSLVAIAGLFVICLAATCSNLNSSNGTLPCTSACPDGYVCGKDNRCWPVGVPYGGGTSVGGIGGFGDGGGGGDADVADAPGGKPPVPFASVDGAGGISGVGGTGAGQSTSTGGTTSAAGGRIVLLGGTPGPIGRTTGGGTTTGGAGGAGGAMPSTDAGVAGAGGGGTGGVLAPADANCGMVTVNLTKQPADLLLILDSSASMTRAMDSANECTAGSTTCQQRWATTVSSLNAALSGTSGDVNWGLKLYSSDGACGVIAAPEVPVSPDTAATILTTIAGVTPKGSTPTRLAIDAGVAYLQTLTDTNGKYILLATDGEPNCGSGSGRGGAGGGAVSDVPGTVTAIMAAAAAGFKVYVIGVGPETGNLDYFAAAGGTDHYFPALSPQDLGNALSSIVAVVASCTFNLGRPPSDPTHTVVELNGDSSLRAPQDTTHVDGWDYTSPGHTAVRLYGTWCDSVMNGTYTSVQVLMPCPSMLIH